MKESLLTLQDEFAQLKGLRKEDSAVRWKGGVRWAVKLPERD